MPKSPREVELTWAGLRSGPQRLTQRQIVALAGEVYAEWVRNMSDEPGEPTIWSHLLQLHRNAREAGKLMEWWRTSIDELLLKKGLVVDASTLERQTDECDKAFVQGCEVLERMSRGDFSPDPRANRFPTWTPPTDLPSSPVAKSGTAVSMTGLVEDWWREAKATGLKPGTYASYRASVAKLVEFVGHDDASRVTEEDIIRFKDFRLAEVHPRTKRPISAKTVNDSDLAGLRRVFDWAVKNRKLPANPAKGVTLRLGKKPKLRSSGFTEEEAKAILSAALHRPASREAPKTAAPKRWVPWLCA